MIYDVSERVKEAWKYFDDMLSERIAQISKISCVEETHMMKINPCDFIEKNRYQKINGYEYQSIDKWIEAHKDDETFLISPLDAVEETAHQIAYKTNNDIKRTLRASQCDVLPVPKQLALDFFIRNHRQSAPSLSANAISFGLVYRDELLSVMTYDIQNGAIRGKNKNYELLRLSISKNTRIHGGASKLQSACESVLASMNIREIYSYSNATINNGNVYSKLGFTSSAVYQGQPFVIMEDNSLIRLANLYPDSTDAKLAKRGRVITHISGNKMWKKNISKGG